ncbi:hypothetical protein B9479_006838 [Cryptococcus floricola]|uniref:Major facilitator superfamily (MFS) profile domain-containing protein n=1 Tax=Cryptococcus floricola TaxID=2591691 RepID=A0A5D3AQM5_9TREE|nr:hypothetical protein B9479_006838 [Cryptococcus floricola]
MARPSVEIPEQLASQLSERPTFERSTTDGKDVKDVETDPEVNHLTQHEQDDDDKASIEVEQSIGVTKIEALYLVFGKGWKLWLLWGSIALIANVYSLSSMTTYNYTAFATSSFGEHTVLGTITVITGIMAGVAKPFLAKMADLWSRPFALAVSVFFYTVGYIIVAASKHVSDVAGGEVLYTLGNTGLDFIVTILLADITSLQWRGAIVGIYSFPYIIWAFVAGDISSGISAYTSEGWRWGYGMFTILVPVCIAPALIILFWADKKAKKVGALSLASSTYTRDMIIRKQEAAQRTWYQTCIHYARQIDAVGLLLLGFAFGCILSPFTLSSTASKGYKNPSLIALLVVGGVLFISFCLWEWKVASHPIMPRRVFNRTFICCVLIDWNYYFSGYLSDAYWSSWLWVAMDYDSKGYTYMQNILTVGLCLFGACAGLVQRYTHRFKYLQLTGLAIRVIGMGLGFMAVNGHMTNAVVVSSRVLISLGGGISVVSSQVAVQGSVPHADMALAMAILSLWTSIGGAIGSAIAAAVWNQRVPHFLSEYVGDVYNATELAEIFGSITVARAAEPRALIIEAYNDAIHPLMLAALLTSMLSLIFGAFTSNFYLGEHQNAIEKKVIAMRPAEETDEQVVARKAAEKEAEIAAKLGVDLEKTHTLEQ